MIYLKYSRPGSEEKDFATATNTISIGTAPTNTIQLDGPAILAKHAQIDATSLHITADTIPISVNGEQTQSHPLENGDIITIGDWALRFFHTTEEHVNERDTRTIKVSPSHHAAPAEAQATATTAGHNTAQTAQETYSPALPTGHILNEYQIESVLGIGSYGITYLAHDSNLSHKVAIKEYFPANLAARNPSTGTVGIKSSDCQDEFAWGKTRYTQEAQTLARFNHPNIVRVSRYFEANSTSYLVMDFVEGKSLETTLKDGQDWTQTQLLDLLLPLLAGLMEIHKVGYLHRDIKPDNIILRSKDNSPVLIDFGAARSTASNTCMTAMVSPGYGPAEQYSSDTTDQGPWTDIYALAAVAYRIVTGRVPIPAPNRVKKDALIPAVFVGNDCYSKPLLAAIDQALSIDETKRPQTASDFAEMLIAASTPRKPQTHQLAPPSTQTAEPIPLPGPKPEITKAEASPPPTEHAPLQATGLLPTSTPNAPPQHASQHNIAPKPERQFKPMPTPEHHRPPEKTDMSPFASQVQRARHLLFACALIAVMPMSDARTPKPPAAPYTTEPERCIIPAAQYHGVNHDILRAILKVESNLNPNAVGKNDNGTLDVGIGQMNSMHLKELSQYGIAQEHLKDACVGTYVAAWHLKKGIAKHGNTWHAVARYHSATPYFNNRYQILLNNELIKAGVIQGKRVPVPPLRPQKTPHQQMAVAKSFAAKD